MFPNRKLKHPVLSVLIGVVFIAIAAFFASKGIVSF